MDFYKAFLRLAVASVFLLLMGNRVLQAQLALDVRVTPDPVQPGELLRYDLTVTDAGASTVSNVTLRSQTSASTTIVAIDGGSCTPDARCLAGYAVNWSLGTLSPGQSVQRQLILRVGAAVAAGTILSNTTQVTATGASEVDVNSPVTVDPTRALAVAIVEAEEPAVPGESLTYIVNFANRGNTADAGVVLQAEVPAGTQFISATQGGTAQAGVVSWNLGTVGVGESGERRFTVEVTDAAGSALFSAAELSDALNPGVARVRAETATPVQVAPPLALDMTLTPDPVQPSELLRVELTVRNRSQITVTAREPAKSDAGRHDDCVHRWRELHPGRPLPRRLRGELVAGDVVARAECTAAADPARRRRCDGGHAAPQLGARDGEQCAGGPCGSLGAGRSGAGAGGGDRRGERAGGAR